MKKKPLRDLGKQVNISSSYYACIAPRSENQGVVAKKKGTMEKTKEVNEDMEKSKKVSEDPISNGESFSISSIADSEINRCNIRNFKGSEVGKNLWGSIEALGVVSERDVTLNEMLLEELEKRDREVMEARKGIKNLAS